MSTDATGGKRSESAFIFSFTFGVKALEHRGGRILLSLHVGVMRVVCMGRATSTVGNRVTHNPDRLVLEGHGK